MTSPACWSRWRTMASNPLPHRGRGWAPRKGRPGEGLSATQTLTLRSLRDGSLPLPQCGRGALCAEPAAQEVADVLGAAVGDGVADIVRQAVIDAELAIPGGETVGSVANYGPFRRLGDVEFRVYDGLPHNICDAELDIA